MKIYYIIPLLLILIIPASAAKYNPHDGLSYYVGADDERIVLNNNNSAKNPTYAQLLNFIKADKSDEIAYDPDKYVCGDVAERVHNRAEKAGIKAAWIYITFEEKGRPSHALNGFYTVDKGAVYIDCTPPYLYKYEKDNWDTKATLKVGSKYKRAYLFKKEAKSPASLGTVKEKKVYW